MEKLILSKKYSCLVITTSLSIKEVIEKFSKINVDIYKIWRKKNKTYIKIKYTDYSIIQKNYFYYDFTIYELKGLLSLNKYIKSKIWIIISVLLSFFLVIFSSNIIYEIDYASGDASSVKNDLKALGIKPLSFKKNYEEIEIIKQVIKENHLDSIEWIEIENVGMKYVINIQNRIITNLNNSNNYCNVYASEDGIIKNIKLYSGTLMVSVGDLVKKGDLLISGDVVNNEDVVLRKCASGIVDAEVWYKTKITLPLGFYKEEKSGKKSINYIIKYKEIDKQLFKNKYNSFEYSTKEIFNLFNIKIYKRIDEEIMEKYVEYTPEEAYKKAIELSNKKLMLKLKDNGTIIEQKILQNEVIDSTIILEVFITAERQVGIQKKEII